MSDRLSFTCPLFVPANRPERFGKAAASGADAIILDLEDAVAQADKDAARAALRVDFTALPVIVRVNGSDTPHYADDIAAVLALPVAAIMLPKAEPGKSLLALSGLPSAPPIIALIETAAGLAAAREIAAHAGVARLAFGSIDLCADLGCAHTRDALLSARSELVLASRLAGILAPLDGVTTAINDAEMAADDARHADGLGFAGKLCIHPRQVAPIRDGFRPTAANVEWAQRVLASGDGAVKVDGAMIDEPVRIRARHIIARSGN